MPYDEDVIGLDELDESVDTDTLDQFPLIPIGIYPARVVKAVPYVAATEKRTRNVNWHCKLDVAKYADLPALHFNTLIPPRDDPKKGWSYAKTLKALGVSSKEFPTIKDQIIAAVNRPCQVSIFHDSYQGQMRSKIGEIMPADGAVSSIRSGPSTTLSEEVPF